MKSHYYNTDNKKREIQKSNSGLQVGLFFLQFF